MIKFLNEIKEPKGSELGGKGYSLAILINNKFNVPRGFVVISEVFFKFLRFNSLREKIEKITSEINETNFQEKSKKIRNLILCGKIPDGFASEMEKSLNKLSARYVSIRSSAVSEDSLKASFAGLHDTFLNIKAEPNLVLENVKKC
jgi:pyruvate,water dikinase